jgi:predicted amidophosphoribosyltransferase
MAMIICPNCLIWVSKEKPLCHKCGYDIKKRPASKSQEIVSKSRSYKSVLLHKFKFLQSTRTY